MPLSFLSRQDIVVEAPLPPQYLDSFRAPCEFRASPCSIPTNVGFSDSSRPVRGCPQPAILSNRDALASQISKTQRYYNHQNCIFSHFERCYLISAVSLR